jgi:hypothetical protein
VFDRKSEASSSSSGEPRVPDTEDSCWAQHTPVLSDSPMQDNLTMIPFSTDDLIDYFAGFLDTGAMSEANQGAADGSLLPLWTELLMTPTALALDPRRLASGLFLDQSYGTSEASVDSFVSEAVALGQSFATSDNVLATFESDHLHIDLQHPYLAAMLSV